MAKKYKDIRYKWLNEKGYNVLDDEYQSAYVESLFAPVSEVQAVFCNARAGTGKTSLAVLAGVKEVESESYDRIIYVRNAVPIRDQGFLPGDLDDKQKPYMQPLIEAMDEVQPGLYEKYAAPATGKVITTTTAYTRGLNWRRSWVILDEFQNFEIGEAQACLTRIADDCKVVVIGSTRQVDNVKLKRFNGLTPFEVYMRHFANYPLARFHELHTNHRGVFSTMADDVQDTIDRLGV